jgi:hypothetical protein
VITADFTCPGPSWTSALVAATGSLLSASTISSGHQVANWRPVTSSAASSAASPATSQETSPSSADTGGRSTIEQARVSDGGLSHRRPCSPRGLISWSTTTTAPWGASS